MRKLLLFLLLAPCFVYGQKFPKAFWGSTVPAGSTPATITFRARGTDSLKTPSLLLSGVYYDFPTTTSMIKYVNSYYAQLAGGNAFFGNQSFNGQVQFQGGTYKTNVNGSIFSSVDFPGLYLDLVKSGNSVEIGTLHNTFNFDTDIIRSSDGKKALFEPDLNTYIPYTGATNNVDLGTRDITTSGNFLGNLTTASNGSDRLNLYGNHIDELVHGANLTFNYSLDWNGRFGGGLNVYDDGTGGLHTNLGSTSLQYGGFASGKTLTINATQPTADRVITWPDKGGIPAMLSDIPGGGGGGTVVNSVTGSAATGIIASATIGDVALLIDTTKNQTVANFFPKGDTRYGRLATPNIWTGLNTFRNTTQPVRFDYDASNGLDVLVSSSGHVALNPTQDIYIGGAGSTQSNLTVTAASNISMLTEYRLGDKTGFATYRLGERGSSSVALTTGVSYGSHIIGTQGVTTFTSGTHDVLAQLAVNPLTVTSSGATVNRTATIYSGGASTGGTGNFSMYSRSGNNFFGGAIGVLTEAPTHTLTFGSTSTGWAAHNQTDQTTNYEYVKGDWQSNTYAIGSYFGGTGTSRNLLFGIQTAAGTTTISNTSGRIFGISGVPTVGTGIFNYFSGTGVNGSMMTLNTNLTGSSGMQNMLSVQGSVTQTSTGGYTAIQALVNEASVGSGSKYLLRLGTSSSPNGGGTITNLFTVDNGGNVTAQAPTYSTGGYSQLVRNATTGRNEVIAGTIGLNRISPLDSLTGVAAGAQIIGRNLLLQSASGSQPGLVTVGTQTIGGNKTLSGNTSFTGTVSSYGAISYFRNSGDVNRIDVIAPTGLSASYTQTQLPATGTQALSNLLIDNILTKTADYTIVSGDFATGKKNTLDLYVDATAGNVTITMPSATTFAGYTIYVTKTDASVNTVTINTVLGGSTLLTQYQSRQFNNNSTSWFNH